MLQLRLHAIPLSDPGGARPSTLTAADLEATVARTNLLFAEADIELIFDPSTDWEPREDADLNDMDRGSAQWPRRPNELAAENGGTLDALDGDLIADTNPDPGTAFWSRHGHSAAGPASVTMSGTLGGTPYSFTLQPPLDNVMSYYGGDRFTPGQVQRMYRTLRHGTRAHLLPAAPEPNAFLLLMAGHP